MWEMKEISKPLGISDYRIVDAIPEKIKITLPSIEELEKVLAEG